MLLSCTVAEVYVSHIFFRSQAAIFDLRHTQTSDSIPTCLSGLPDSANMGIQPLEFRCYRVYELRYTLFPIYFRLMAAICDFQHIQTSDTILTSCSMLPDPENMGLAVGIVFLLCLQGKIWILPVWRSPSWVTHFRLGHLIFLIVILDSSTLKT